MKKVITAVVALMVVALMALGFMQATQHHFDTDKIPDAKGIIFEHLGDSYSWEVPFSHDCKIPLPCIVQDIKGDWHVFSSAHINHGQVYEAAPGVSFKVDETEVHHNRLVQVEADGGKDYRPLDFSFTKNALGIFIAAFVVILLVFKVRGWHKKHGMKAPRKGTAFLEVIVDFVYNDTIRPIMGREAPKYAPYLLTAFFFILTMNLLGLIVIFPGGANLTGNLAVTMFLAVCTFLVTNFTGTKHYWKDLFWPDVPMMLKCPVPLMPVIEIFGVFTKPFALMIRLFANMMGGHMVVIVFTMLIFIFSAMYGWVAGAGTTVLSLALSLFMLLLDTLVSFIQAYVFTILSTMFIFMAHVHEEEHESIEK